jgi:hypothetical protein
MADYKASRPTNSNYGVGGLRAEPQSKYDAATLDLLTWARA